VDATNTTEPATAAADTAAASTTTNDVITSWDTTGHHDHGGTATADAAHAAGTHSVGDAGLRLDVDGLAHAGLWVGHHGGGRRGNLNGEAVCLDGEKMISMGTGKATQSIYANCQTVKVDNEKSEYKKK
jgi:hypothetical protein